MEEKKFDLNSLIGFVLIGAILVYMLYLQQPTPEEIEAEKQKTEQLTEEEDKPTQNETQEVTLDEGIQEIASVVQSELR